MTELTKKVQVWVCVCHTRESGLVSAHWSGACEGHSGKMSCLLTMRYDEIWCPLINSIRVMVNVEAQLLAGNPTYIPSTHRLITTSIRCLKRKQWLFGAYVLTCSSRLDKAMSANEERNAVSNKKFCSEINVKYCSCPGNNISYNVYSKGFKLTRLPDNNSKCISPQIMDKLWVFQLTLKYNPPTAMQPRAPLKPANPVYKASGCTAKKRPTKRERGC